MSKKSKQKNKKFYLTLGIIILSVLLILCLISCVKSYLKAREPLKRESANQNYTIYLNNNAVQSTNVYKLKE
jgi:hypothetical protein